MRAAGEKSRRHRRSIGDNGGNEALPQTCDVGSDKRREDGGREVAREYAAEKKWLRRLAMAYKNFQGWLTERRSGNERWRQEMVEMVEWQ
jgi:hypothetical protein